MASLIDDPGGRRRIQFVAADGTRPAIRLGKISRKTADGVKRKVEALLAAKITGQPLDRETATWLADLPPKMARKLARHGLIEPPQQKAAVTLGEHLANYFARRTDVKPSTMTHWRHSNRCLLAFFGAGRPLHAITAGEARDWERWLKGDKARENRYADRKADEGLAPNTVRKRVSNAKQFFQDAVSRDLLAKNPFAGLKGTVGNNRDRDYFIDRDTAQKVLDACPDAQWRLMFALARYGGLRCPSEHLAMTWADVNWVEGKMLIRSAKTEHHEGKGSRLVPIFPELRPYLEDVRELAEADAVHVITRCRNPCDNLRTQLKRIITKAGVKPWPKLWQNLRASRATELAGEYAAHVAAAWLGHSTLVANKHYWQVTDADFAKALGTNSEAAQKTAQQPHAASRIDPQTSRPTVDAGPSAQKKPPALPGFAALCETLQAGGIMLGMGDEGLEPPTSTV